MPRKKVATTPADADDNQLAPLLRTVESLATQVEALASQVEVLRQVLDEIRDDFQWALQNDKLRSSHGHHGSPVVHITSLPKDPCTEDWEINRVKPEDLPSEPPVAPATKTSTKQTELWD